MIITRLMNIMQKSNVRVMLTSSSEHIDIVYEIYSTKNMLLLHSCKECALYLKSVSIWIVFKNLFFKVCYSYFNSVPSYSGLSVILITNDEDTFNETREQVKKETRQSSDGETRRNWKKALSLVEEEVWRKGLGKTEGSGFNLTTLFCSTLVHLSSIHAHPVFNHPLSSHSLLTPTPCKCQGLPEKALI